MTTRKVKVIKRHRSAASGEFVTKDAATKSPLDTLAESVRTLPKIDVAFNVWDKDLKNMLAHLSQEGVIIGLCCQPDGRYTIAVERAK